MRAGGSTPEAPISRRNAVASIIALSGFALHAGGQRGNATVVTLSRRPRCQTGRCGGPREALVGVRGMGNHHLLADGRVSACGLACCGGLVGARAGAARPRKWERGRRAVRTVARNPISCLVLLLGLSEAVAFLVDSYSAAALGLPVGRLPHRPCTRSPRRRIHGTTRCLRRAAKLPTGAQAPVRMDVQACSIPVECASAPRTRSDAER